MPTWKDVLKDLIDSGLTKADIAGKCDAGFTTVHDLARGKTTHPRWDLGLKIHNLHRQRCPDRPGVL